MNHEPLVSAIIPTYNRAGVVHEAVESVLKQTYSNIEVIVVDDGSTDGTQAQLAQYANVRSILQKNAGPAAARNRGISVARGELIAFLDSDDIWLPTKIERQVRLLNRLGDSVPCCLCNILMRWPERERASFDIAWLATPFNEGIWLNVAEVVATRFVLFNQGVMIRRAVLEKIGGFNERLWLLEDHELALRLSLEGPWAFVRDPLVIWRETKSSLSHEAQRQELLWSEVLVQILERHLAVVTSVRRSATLQKQVSCELKRARRQVALARMKAKGSWGAAAIGSTLRRVEQYRAAAARRLPRFPKMRARRLGL